MGEIAEMMLDGTLCQGCGVFIGEDFPSYCDGCAKERTPRAASPKKQKPRGAEAYRKVICTACNRRFANNSAHEDHFRQKHGDLK